MMMFLTKLRVVVVAAVIILGGRMALWTNQTLAQVQRGGTDQPKQPAIETPRVAASRRDKNLDAVARKPEDAYPVWKATGVVVDSLAWSRDSMILAILTRPFPGASDSSRKIQFWNVNEGRLARLLYETKDAIFSVEFSPDGKRLAYAAWPAATHVEKPAGGAWTSEVRLLDVVGGKLTQTLEIATKDEHGSPMSFDLLKIAFSPDGKKIAGGGKLVSTGDIDMGEGFGEHVGGQVCLWDLESGKLKWRQRSLHTDIVYDVAFSPDGRLLASAGLDKLIRLLDPETGELKQTLFGAGWDGVEAVSWSHDSALLASTGFGREEGGHSRLWTVRSGRLSKTLSPSNEVPIIWTAFSPVDDDALFCLVAAKQGEGPGWQVRRWNRRGERMDDVTSKQMGNARLMRVSPDGKKIAVSTYSAPDDQAVRIFDVSPRVAPDR